MAIFLGTNCAHAGRIEVGSASGVGADFGAVLPLTAIDAADRFGQRDAVTEAVRDLK